MEAKRLMVEHLLPSIASFGYELKKGNSSDFEFVRKTPVGEDVIGGGFTDYNPVQRIIYSVTKSYKEVNAVLMKVQAEGLKMIPKVTRSSGTLGFSYSSFNGLNTLQYLPDIRTEADVAKNVEMMMEFLAGTAFPLLDKFNDIREVDAIIDGNEPWCTDWQMPYSFGAQFYEKRLVIAKLAGNPRFEELADFTYTTIERLSAESGSPFTYDRNNYSMPIPAIVRALSDVRPLN